MRQYDRPAPARVDDQHSGRMVSSPSACFGTVAPITLPPATIRPTTSWYMASTLARIAAPSTSRRIGGSMHPDGEGRSGQFEQLFLEHLSPGAIHCPSWCAFIELRQKPTASPAA